MATRLTLQQKLSDIFETSNVYFNPPETLKLNYPCVIYSRENGRSLRADNISYIFKLKYQIMYIGKDVNPEALIKKAMISFKTIEYDRHYFSNGLSYDVFNLYW